MKPRSIICLFTAAALILSAAGCGKSSENAENPETQKIYFQGTVLDKREESLLVMPAEDAPERLSSDQIEISVKAAAEIDKQSAADIEALRIGDTVKIGYDGYILESYPAIINKAFSIRRITDSEYGHTPPPLIGSEQEYGFTRFVMEPKTCSWSWKNKNGEMNGVEMDAIHPLDPEFAKTPRQTISETPEGAEYVFTSGWPITEVTYDRWDAGSIGFPETEPIEQAVPCPENTIRLLPDSVYCIHAAFSELDGALGDAYYYLITAPANEETPANEDAPENAPDNAADAPDGTADNANASDAAYDPSVAAVLASRPEAVRTGSIEEYINGDSYYDWFTSQLEKYRISAKWQPAMDAYYASILPRILSGEENSAASPLNLYFALSVLAEVSDGNTRAQILQALGAPDIESLREQNAALWDANAVDSPLLTSLPANSLWLNDAFGYSSHPENIGKIAEMYHASVFSGLMGTDAMNDALRKWTDDATNGLLKEFTQEMYLEPETILEIVSTIYFKTSWSEPFSANQTKEETFHGINGDKPCEMMHKSGTGAYYCGGTFSAVQLPLTESGSVYFFLPDEGKNISEMLADPGVLELARQNSLQYSGDWDPEEDTHPHVEEEYKIVNISVPKYDVSSKTDIRELMKDLGITDAFSKEISDFSPLTDEKEVYVSKAEHAARISVDEEGVTGAAYTDIGLCGAGMPPEEEVDFVLNRPFAFIITSRDGSILFAGSVCDL